jgi:putative NADH-flavin reductase
MLRSVDDLDWTVLSPGFEFTAGERTGKFRLGNDELIVDKNDKSAISFEDYAIALVDEMEQPRHLKKRFSIGY